MFTVTKEDICVNTCTDSATLKSTHKTKGIKRKVNEASGDKSENITSEQGKSKEQDIVQTEPATNDKTDSCLLASLTGIRPRVAKCSLNRYSPEEWRNHNAKVLNDDKLIKSNILAYNGETIIKAANGNIDKVRFNNNNRLKQRAKEIFKWKVEIELACKAMAKEIELLELERQRLKNALKMLMLSESICKECIGLRSSRTETDLVMDLTEQEFLREIKLVGEIKETLTVTLHKIEEQLASNKAAKNRIEYDWCDKTFAYETEILNLSLNIRSNTIMFKPGATKFTSGTTPQSYWEYHCRKNIKDVQAVRQTSANLRSSLNYILINNGKQLRLQADKTDCALAETISFTSQLLTKLEEHLRKTLQSLIKIEQLILNLQNSIRKMDYAMKLAQTKLDNRNNCRPHQENVIDLPHEGLLQEVKLIHENVTSLAAQLNIAENHRKCLIERRRDIEIDIFSKKKTLNIDSVRCGMIRSYYPTSSELAGL